MLQLDNPMFSASELNKHLKDHPNANTDAVRITPVVGTRKEHNRHPLTTSEEDAILDADPFTGSIRAIRRRLFRK